MTISPLQPRLKAVAPAPAAAPHGRPALRTDVFTIQGLLKVFGDDKPYVALKDVDLDVRNGEFLCLLGASGCGKSTLLNLMAGFEQPTGGALHYRGRPIAGPGRERVMFFQDANAALLPWQTVQQNVEFGLKLQGIRPAERRERVESCLELVGLVDHRHKVPSEMSGGMRQRLQIARALAVEPDVLLMDEPFAALDAITRRRMHEALLEVWSRAKRTIVFVTHDIMEALTLADRIAIMSVGPGSRIAHMIEVDHARPRNPADPGLAKLFGMLEHLLHGVSPEEAMR
jgi:NitT/TauT family transport system ATP-binding protein